MAWCDCQWASRGPRTLFRTWTRRWRFDLTWKAPCANGVLSRSLQWVTRNVDGFSGEDKRSPRAARAPRLALSDLVDFSPIHEYKLAPCSVLPPKERPVCSAETVLT